MGTNFGWVIYDVILFFEDSFVFGRGSKKFQTLHVDDCESFTVCDGLRYIHILMLYIRHN